MVHLHLADAEWDYTTPPERREAIRQAREARDNIDFTLKWFVAMWYAAKGRYPADYKMPPEIRSRLVVNDLPAFLELYKRLGEPQTIKRALAELYYRMSKSDVMA